jgi:hypothetical protein
MVAEMMEQPGSAVWELFDVGGRVRGQVAALDELVPSPAVVMSGIQNHILT